MRNKEIQEQLNTLLNMTTVSGLLANLGHTIDKRACETELPSDGPMWHEIISVLRKSGTRIDRIVEQHELLNDRQMDLYVGYIRWASSGKNIDRFTLKRYCEDSLHIVWLNQTTRDRARSRMIQRVLFCTPIGGPMVTDDDDEKSWAKFLDGVESGAISATGNDSTAYCGDCHVEHKRNLMVISKMGLLCETCGTMSRYYAKHYGKPRT